MKLCERDKETCSAFTLKEEILIIRLYSLEKHDYHVFSLSVKALYFSYFSFSEYLLIFSLLFECFHFALATFYPLSALTTDYLNLVQCETLEDLKLHLASTDYGNFLANEAGPLSVNTIDDKLKEKLVVEFQHMRNQVISYIKLGSGSVIEF